MYPENVAIKCQEMSEQDVLTFTNLLTHMKLIKFHSFHIIQLQKETVQKQFIFTLPVVYSNCNILIIFLVKCSN